MEFIPCSFVVIFHLLAQPTCHLFLCCQRWLLNLHKHPLALVYLYNQMNPKLCLLFCLHIQDATCCRFERRRLIGSPEIASCSFRLSILLRTFLLIFYFVLILFWLIMEIYFFNAVLSFGIVKIKSKFYVFI